MSDKFFTDTNLLIYARDNTEPEKQDRAAAWMRSLWLNRNGRLSTQVLNEYYVNVTRKLKPSLPREQAWSDVTELFNWGPIAIDTRLLEKSNAVNQRYELSWWDGMIVAAAAISGCSYLLSEDLQSNQQIEGVQIINPFEHEPESFS